MNMIKNKHQEEQCKKGRGAFTILYSLFTIALLLLGSNAAEAACLTTIPATTPTSDFVDHGDGTVSHTKTGLMWKQCSEGLSGAGCATGAATVHTWQAALQLADTLNAGAGFAGFNDWRLPNIKELNSIVERQCFTPAINATLFPNTASNGYWSSSSYAATAAGAWGVGFDGGGDGAYYKSGSGFVRLVRGGQ